MADKLSKPEAQKILGVAGQSTLNGSIRADEFLPELKGRNAIRKYREMRENDSTIGAVMYAVEQILRDVDLKVIPADESDQAKKEAEFVQSVLDDMDHTLDDHVSESLAFLSYGFSWFEVVYKRRVGPSEKSPKKRSKYTDGRMGIRKIASRAPWTVARFDVDQKTGDVKGIQQNVGLGINRTNTIPTNKSLYYRTPTINNDPSGRSILRNAFTSYTYLNNLQSIEAIAIERELNGIPVGRLPADYLAEDATDDQKAVAKQLANVLENLKFGKDGYAMLPSDKYTDGDGKPSNHFLMDIQLMASEGSRNMAIDPVIRRYQHDIARSILSEFLMLGSGSTGSYALSKSKTDLFLRALESYIQSIVDVLNKQMVERLWQINGLNYDLMPKIEAGDVAPHDLKELGSYLRNLNGADINLSDQVEIIDALLGNAELPKLDRDVYEKSQEEKRKQAEAKAQPQVNPEEVDDGE
jgi:hypothetical protein